MTFSGFFADFIKNTLNQGSLSVTCLLSMSVCMSMCKCVCMFNFVRLEIPTLVRLVWQDVHSTYGLTNNLIVVTGVVVTCCVCLSIQQSYLIHSLAVHRIVNSKVRKRFEPRLRQVQFLVV